MRILILNWRDIKNPSSGGAEVLTHEIAKRLVRLGNKVIQFSGYFNGAAKEEVIDGVKIIREGHSDLRTLFFSVQFRAFLFYKREHEKYDLVIDEIHGMPFFTPLYVREKKIVLICEVASDLWIKFFGLFFGTLGRLVEKFYFLYIYKDIRYMAISKSTRNDLLENGVDKNRITVLPMGINIPKNVRYSRKEKKTTFVFVGRLIPAKGIEDALIAIKKIKEQNKICKFWVIGRGDSGYVKKLRNLCRKLQIENVVTFFGYVNEQEKFSLLSRAHLLIHPSVKEGFGLTIPEAGFVGMPVIAYNSPGLRDIVKNNKNGILLSENSPDAIANAAIRVTENHTFYQNLCAVAKEEAKQYNWENTIQAVLDSIKRL